MRRMYDSTTAADIPDGSVLVMGYDDGSSAWSEADWQRFPGRILVHICIFNNRYDSQVIDIEPGNNNANGAVSWIREKWLRGQVPTVYCFTDLGPVGYRISDVRAACDESGVKRPLILVTDADGVAVIPDDPEVIGKQYADSALTGGHYDVSVVRDEWPGVDGGDMTPEEVQTAIDASIAAYGQRLQAELDANYAGISHTHPAQPAVPHTHKANTTVEPT